MFEIGIWKKYQSKDDKASQDASQGEENFFALRLVFVLQVQNNTIY